MPLRTVHTGDARELKDIADVVAKSHKVLVVTGAGISTSCGIPDFRSKDGLYNMIPEQSLPTPPPSEPSTPSHKRKASSIEEAETPVSKRRAVDTDDEELPSSQSSISSRGGRRSSGSPVSKMRGQDLFHARVFQRADTTQVFNQFIAGFKQKLRADVTETSKTHKFIRALRDGGRLMRCYTQNIDGLEEREGLCVDLARGKGNKRRFMKKQYELPRPDIVENTDFDGGCEVVQLHGELTNLRCTVCSTEEEWTEEASEILLEGAAPNCNKCNDKSAQRQATGKRGLTVGTLRPNIVLYGEEHPQNTLLSPLVPYDIASGPEVMIIMGTSLKVFGMQKIIRDFAKAIHGKKNGRVIFVNRTRPAESVWESIIDDFVEMDCDDWVDDLKERRPGLWLRQGELDLKEVKQPSLKRKRKPDIVEDAEKAPVKQANIKHNQLISVNIPRRKTTPKAQTAKPNLQTKPEDTPRATKWKNAGNAGIAGEFKNLLSPLMQSKRPQSSPLRSRLESATPSRRSLPGSPQPPPFSPLTPTTPSRYQSRTPSHLRIQQNANTHSAASTAACITPGKPPSRSQPHTTDPDLENRSPSPNPPGMIDPDHAAAVGDAEVDSPPRDFNGQLVAAQTDGATDDVGQPLYRLGTRSLIRRILGAGVFIG